MAQAKYIVTIFDKRHAEDAAKRKRSIGKMYDEIVKEAAKAAQMTGFNDPDKHFYLQDFPAANKAINELLANMAVQMVGNIEQGNEDAWRIANAKNDAIVNLVTAHATKHGVNIPKQRTDGWQQRNLDALQAFQQRTVQGMGLSERVWRICEQVKSELELALEIGLGDGKSAAALSRDVRSYLQQPAKLFRRVRDKKTGALRLSKAAQEYHTGRGVYRSSYKNALRLTATENNMAYRSADHARWQQMPFILGFTVKLSGNHPCEDICDTLQGDYPKEFKFVGWHPWCRCYTVAKLPSDADFLKYAESEDIDNYQFKGVVKDVPPQFAQWVQDNQQRIMAAKSLPYFIKDNFVNGNINKGYSFIYKELGEVGGYVPASFNTEQQRRWINDKNIIDSWFGITQGDAMSHIQADNNAVNPNYSKSKGYRNNCQSCVVTYEMRRRGFDVEVKERIVGITKEMDYLAHKTNYAWLDRNTSKPPKITDIMGNIGDIKTGIESAVKQTGRYHFVYMPKNTLSRKSHILCIENDAKGNIMVYDPQKNTTYTVDELVKRVDTKYKTHIYRVDDTQINVDIIKWVMKKK